MRVVSFALCGVIVLVGIITLIVTNIIRITMPLLGRVAYQAAAIGSYSPDWYRMDFSGVDTFAKVLIITGVLFGIILYKKGKKQDK